MSTITTPIEECLAAKRARREARGDARPLNEKNTRGRYESCLRTACRLTDAGIAVERLSREDAFRRVCTLLRLTSPVSSEVALMPHDVLRWDGLYSGDWQHQKVSL